MKYISILLVVLIIPLIVGCQEIIKYQCSDGSIVDAKENCSIQKCPVCESKANDCSICPVQTRNITLIKYQCSDGSLKDSLGDCPAMEIVEEQTLSDYETSKHLINKKVTRYPFEFTVKYVGFDGADYKIEFEVKNAGSETEYFQPTGIAILDSNNNQYDIYNTFDYPVSALSSTILSGVTKRGYWIFENVPKNSGMGTFQFETGFTDKETFSFAVPLN